MIEKRRCFSKWVRHGSLFGSGSIFASDDFWHLLRPQIVATLGFEDMCWYLHRVYIVNRLTWRFKQKRRLINLFFTDDSKSFAFLRHWCLLLNVALFFSHRFCSFLSWLQVFKFECFNSCSFESFARRVVVVCQIVTWQIINLLYFLAAFVHRYRRNTALLSPLVHYYWLRFGLIEHVNHAANLILKICLVFYEFARFGSFQLKLLERCISNTVLWHFEVN